MTISFSIISLSKQKEKKMNLLQTLKHYGIKSVWHFTDRGFKMLQTILEKIDKTSK